MVKQKTPKSSKLENVLEMVHQHAKIGRIIDTRHSIFRQNGREVTFSEIIQVLEEGWHEKIKDEWKAEYSAWNYSIRGRTLDGDELRVPVFFDNKDPKVTYFGVVTVIKLSKPKELL
jgi:hypothetical protein